MKERCFNSKANELEKKENLKISGLQASRPWNLQLRNLKISNFTTSGPRTSRPQKTVLIQIAQDEK